MNQLKGSTYKANINDWAIKLSEISSLVDFARRIDEPRNVGFENLNKFNLPQIKTYTTTLADFIENIDSYFTLLNSKKCYFSLMPKIPGLNRFGEKDVNKEQSLDFIDLHVLGPDRSNYNILVGPYDDNLIGGNIIINDNGNFLFEFKKGSQTEVAKGNVNPAELFFITKDEFSDVLRFSFDDISLRNVSYKALMTVPHEGKGRDVKFMPGYYEVVVVLKGLFPTVYFLDYRDNSAYSEKL